MEEYESILLVKPDVHVFKIPPRQSNRGYRAADWNLAAPDWSGRMRLVAIAQKCILKLEDKTTGDLFAQCPIDQYPGPAIEAVNDSSRYFVIKIQDDSGRSAFIGIGFTDRSDSFDLNVALQDHFKWLKKSDAPEDLQPKLDLGFKDGQTIKINMNIAKKEGATDSPSRSKQRPAGTGFLPPPPGGSRIAPPPLSSKTSPVSPSDSSLLDLGSGTATQSSEWSDFASAAPQARVPSSSTPSNTNWVQF